MVFFCLHPAPLSTLSGQSQAALTINHPHGKQWQRFLLLRRSRSKAGEITAYLVFGRADTTLEEMARVAARRWAIEESFAQSKSEAGLEQYEVRSWAGWHRHMTLAMTAQTLLAIRSPAHGSSPSPWRAAKPWPPSKKPRTAGGHRRLIRVSVAEVRRFFVALLWGTARVLIAHVLRWSNGRRHHQALAKLFHYKTPYPLAYLQL